MSMSDNIYQEVQPEMIEKVRKNLADGMDMYAIYAMYKNLAIQEEASGELEEMIKYQFACDLAKHMICEQAMKEHGYRKTGSQGFFEKDKQD